MTTRPGHGPDAGPGRDRVPAGSPAGTAAAVRRPTGPHQRQAGVAALEFALSLPLVALLLVAGLGLTGVVRTTLVVQEAARLGVRVAAVEPDDGAVRRAVIDVVGPDATVVVGPRRVHDVVTVTVEVPVEVAGLRHRVVARAAAVVEPVVGP